MEIHCVQISKNIIFFFATLTNSGWKISDVFYSLKRLKPIVIVTDILWFSLTLYNQPERQSWFILSISYLTYCCLLWITHYFLRKATTDSDCQTSVGLYPWKGQLLLENFPSDMINSLYCGTSAVSISKNHDIISQEKINRISSSEKKGLCYHFLNQWWN